MATFEQCISSLNDFYSLLETFNGAALSLVVAPVDNKIPPSGYGYLVALGRHLEEREQFPTEFNNIPVTSFVMDPGYRDRMKDFELE